MRIAPLIAAAGLALAAAPAAAQPSIPTHFDHNLRVAIERYQWVQHGLAVAARMWPNACAPITVSWARLPDALGGEAVIAECRIVLSTWQIPMFSDRRWTCALVVHEVGHLAGQGHSTDPKNVMYPLVPYIPECR